MIQETKRFWAGLWLIAILGVLILLYATPLGIAILPDSVVYLVSAESLLEGRGLNTSSGVAISPMEHYAPLYPLIVSGISLTGLDLFSAAKGLALAVLAANILLTGWVIYRSSGGSVWAAWLGALFIALPINLLRAHGSALSEPLFLLFGFAGLFFVARFIKSGRSRHLLFAGILAALAFLDRFTGAVVIAAGAAAVFLYAPNSFSRRIFGSLAYGLASAVPAAAWTVMNALASGNIANRQIAYHPIQWSQIQFALTTPTMVYILLLFLFTGGVLILSRYFQQKLPESLQKTTVSGEQTPFVRVLILFAALYVAFLMLSISFMDAHTLLNDRLLLPFYVAVMSAVLILTGRAVRPALTIRAFRTVLKIASLVLVVGLGIITAIWSTKENHEGRGFLAREWQESELVAYVETIPANKHIYSNAADAIYILSERHTRFIPFKHDATSLQPNEDYEKELASMGKNISEGKALLLYFDTVYWRGYIPTLEELEEEIKLELKLEFEDGSIYRGMGGVLDVDAGADLNTIINKE